MTWFKSFYWRLANSLYYIHCSFTLYYSSTCQIASSCPDPILTSGMLLRHVTMYFCNLHILTIKQLPTFKVPYADEMECECETPSGLLALKFPGSWSHLNLCLDSSHPLLALPPCRIWLETSCYYSCSSYNKDQLKWPLQKVNSVVSCPTEVFPQTPPTWGSIL